MAPPKSAAAATKAAPPPAKPAPAPAASAPASSNAVQSLWKAYYENTSTRLKTIDAFLVFLMLSGIIQFLYCILVTNFPFNAFLAGYASCTFYWANTHDMLSDLQAASDNSFLLLPSALK